MFETRSEAWERAGLAVEVSSGEVRRARAAVLVLFPLIVGILVVYAHRKGIFGLPQCQHGKCPQSSADTAIQWGTVALLLILGWTLARDVGRAAGPTFFRRMDPGTAGTVGFVVRLVTIAVTVLLALGVAGVNTGSLIAGGAFTAVVLGLAAQQTLGNFVAGLSLAVTQPVRLGDAIEVDGTAGVVEEIGLTYTWVRTSDHDMVVIPNQKLASETILNKTIRKPA